MEDDWASDGEEEAGLGDISAIPEVKIPDPPPRPAEPAKPAKPQRAPNAWGANQSNDVRSALRRPQAPGPPRPQPPGPRPHRRDSFPTSFASTADRSDRSARAPPGSPHPRPTTLYVTNLPFDASEAAIAAFFRANSVAVDDVRITRHSDTGNIKAAFVVIPPEQNKNQALAVDGRTFGSRNLHVKVDGTDGNRRRDRSNSYGSVSYGGGFGGRERRDEMNNGGWGSGGWGDRSSSSYDGNLERRASDTRDDRRRESHPKDPTIPTGPTPSGRKKLQLKPRTKPPPVLDVDQRAIDPPRAPASAPAAMGPGADRPSSRAAASPRKLPSSQDDKTDKEAKLGAEPADRGATKKATENGDEQWTAAKETGPVRSPSANQSVNKKEDDSKRPVLLNAFAALEVNESDT